MHSHRPPKPVGRRRQADTQVPPQRNMAVNAAALQDHFSRTLSLGMGRRVPGSSHNRHRSHTGATSGSHRTVRNPDSRARPHTPPSPSHPTRESRVAAYEKSLSLAQKLGLMAAPPPPPPPMTTGEWDDAREKAQQRDDHQFGCPICQEEFGAQEQVILSCTHVFHRVCLGSFERYNRKRCCPLCRAEDYEKHPIDDAAKLYRNLCAVLVQAHVRGMLTRKRTQPLLDAIVPEDEQRRKMYYAKKLGSVTNELINQLDVHASAVDVLFAEIDRNVNQSRQIMSLAEAASTPAPHKEHDDGGVYSSTLWSRAQLMALNRPLAEESCPICLVPFHQHHRAPKRERARSTRRPVHAVAPERPKPIVLLTCSHLAHAGCLTSFERFSTEGLPLCPVCRAVYQSAHVSYEVTTTDDSRPDGSRINLSFDEL